MSQRGARVLGIAEQHLWFAPPNNGSRSATEDVKRRPFLTTSVGLAGALVGSAALSLPTSDLAAAMLAARPTATEPASVADLTKQVTTAWRLRQRACLVQLKMAGEPALTSAPPS